MSCAQADATDLAYGDSIRGSITPAGDTDCFRVTSTGGWLTAYTEGATDTRGSLSDRSYNGLESDDNDGPQDNFLIRRDLSSGTYYLQVAGQQANTTGAYLLKVDDHGDSRQTATPLAVGDSVAGNIVTPGNVDFFRIEVREAGLLTVLTTGETDTQGYLYDGSGGLLAENDDGVIDTNFPHRTTSWRRLLLRRGKGLRQYPHRSLCVERVPLERRPDDNDLPGRLRRRQQPRQLVRL